MRVAVFSTKPYDRESLDAANQAYRHELVYFDARLTELTCRCLLADHFDAVCVFVNDGLNRAVLATLKAHGIRLVALRCAGFNNIDLNAAAELGLQVVRVPAYSPEAVAEHTITLMLALSRRIYRAYNRVREGNFRLDGLLGFNLHGKTVGLIGTGRIGASTARILTGFGCSVLAYDPIVNPDCTQYGVDYVELDTLYRRSDIISLHCPLTEDTRHMINSQALNKMKKGVMIINTSRGAVIDTKAVIVALKNRTLGYLGIDVYEQEGDLFFEDLSNEIIHDDVFERLLTFPNVLVTGHQGYFTREALAAIADITLNNIRCFEQNQSSGNELGASHRAG